MKSFEYKIKDILSFHTPTIKIYYDVNSLYNTERQPYQGIEEVLSYSRQLIFYNH